MLCGIQRDSAAVVCAGLPLPEVPGGATRIAVGGDFACAVARDGATWCWGNNTSGQVGIPASDAPAPLSRVTLLADE